MALLVTVVLFVAVAVVTGSLLRVQAHRRGRALPDLVRAQRARWGALCRVTSGGTFLDHGRPRRGMGPRGTLLADDHGLRWLPDKYEREHGDRPVTWTWQEVRCTNSRPYRDLTGAAGEKLTLFMPQGRTTLVAFHATGNRPSQLRP